MENEICDAKIGSLCDMLPVTLGHIIWQSSMLLPASRIPLQHAGLKDKFMTRTIAHYSVLEQIGEGTYGQVYRGACRDSGRIVALKRMQRMQGEIPQQFVREIKILKNLYHENLLELIEVVTSKGVEHLDPDDPPHPKHKQKAMDKAEEAREKLKGTLFLVLEYVSHDLMGLLDIQYKFEPVHIKCIFRQLLLALEHMHKHKYVHRDIKSSNILLDNHFRLKLADFGLARCMEPPLLDYLEDRRSTGTDNALYTNKVITLWYRPPEILLGTTSYGPAVDIWSAGCILAELWQGKPLFPGKAEMDQWRLILEVLGTPTNETWNYISKQLPKCKNPLSISLPHDPISPKWQKKYARRLEDVTGLKLLMKLLEWDPRQRLTASQALRSRYFESPPVAPHDPSQLGIVLSPHTQLHEFQTKAKRKNAKAESEKHRDELLAKGKPLHKAEQAMDDMYQKLMKEVADSGFEQKKADARTAEQAANPNFEKEQEEKRQMEEKRKAERKVAEKRRREEERVARELRRDRRRQERRNSGENRHSDDRRHKDLKHSHRDRHRDDYDDERNYEHRKRDRHDEDRRDRHDDRRERDQKRSRNEPRDSSKSGMANDREDHRYGERRREEDFDREPIRHDDRRERYGADQTRDRDDRRGREDHHSRRDYDDARYHERDNRDHQRDQGARIRRHDQDDYRRRGQDDRSFRDDRHRPADNSRENQRRHSNEKQSRDSSWYGPGADRVPDHRRDDRSRDRPRDYCPPPGGRWPDHHRDDRSSDHPREYSSQGNRGPDHRRDERPRDHPRDQPRFDGNPHHARQMDRQRHDATHYGPGDRVDDRDRNYRQGRNDDRGRHERQYDGPGRGRR